MAIVVVPLVVMRSVHPEGTLSAVLEGQAVIAVWLGTAIVALVGLMPPRSDITVPLAKTH